MTDCTHETVFQEHWRRFFLLPQQLKEVEDVLAGALYQTDQIAWSLGIVPWNSWRRPFQRTIIQYLSQSCSPEVAEKLYEAANTALATAHGDYFSLPAEQDRDNLIATFKALCSPQLADKLAELLKMVQSPPPFWHSPTLERVRRRLSKKYRIKRERLFITYLSCLLNFRVVNNFIKRCENIFCGNENEGAIDILASAAWYILTETNLSPPHFYTSKRLKADINSISPEIYKFWSWQYTYRNEEYQKLRKPLEKFVFKNSQVFVPVPIATHTEYDAVFPRTFKGEYGFFESLCPEYDATITAMAEKFDHYPAWPISGYTSDFILGRMLSGEFRYWERETPQPKVSRLKEFTLCTRNAALCDREDRVTTVAMDGETPFEMCAPECVVARKSEEQDICQSITNEERSRIRPEAIHRMIGLWLWDYCHEHGIKPAEAMRALKARHFPEENPAWDASRVDETKNNPQCEDWYDYRERTTTTPVLYADYQDACRCIEAAKFLPRQRGVKKSPNPASTKKK